MPVIPALGGITSLKAAWVVRFWPTKERALLLTKRIAICYLAGYVLIQSHDEWVLQSEALDAQREVGPYQSLLGSQSAWLRRLWERSLQRLKLQQKLNSVLLLRLGGKAQWKLRRSCQGLWPAVFFAWETYGCAHVSTCCSSLHCFSYIFYQINKLAKSNQVSSFALYRLRKNCNWFLRTSNLQVLWRTKIIGWRIINQWDSLCKYHLNGVHVLKRDFSKWWQFVPWHSSQADGTYNVDMINL